MVFHCRDLELHLPNGTRQIKIQVENFSENKKIKAVQDHTNGQNWRETTHFSVEVRTVSDKKRENLVTRYKFTLAVCRKQDLNLSNDRYTV